MKRIALCLLLWGLVLIPAASAQEQDHAALGVYADYFHLSQTNSNFGGVGGRFGFAVVPHVMLEAEMSYDFSQVFTEDFFSGTTISIQRTNMRLLHGLAGPRVALGHSNFHPFITVKGGFLNSRIDPAPATLGTFTSSVADLRAKDVMGAVYPAGGLEGHLGPIGLRLEAGDEIYFNNGAHHNLRVSFGPYIRF